MPSDRETETELLKTVLEPLLEDFQYWFASSRSILETERLPFLTETEQAEFLAKIKHNQQEVKVAQMLFEATEKTVGIDFQMLLPWHQLVTECWDVARKYRQLDRSHHTDS
jgi:hypothetical protein